MPADCLAMPAACLRAIIHHELAYHQRRDLPRQTVAALACACWWWNPLVWKLLNRLKSETELAADEFVVANRESAADYAEVLVRMAGNIPFGSITRIGLPMAGQSPIEGRVRAILADNPFRNRMSWRAVSGGALIAMGGLVVASVSAVAKDGVSETSVRMHELENHRSQRAELLKGVGEINTHGDGIPGGLSMFGRDAFAVVAGSNRDGKSLLPVVAAGELGKGRVVAFGHDGFLIAADRNDTGRLLENSVRWVSRNENEPKIGVYGLFDSEAALLHLRSSGFKAVLLDGVDWIFDIREVSVVYVNAAKLRPGDVDPLVKFVREGGGLITGVTGWGWSQMNGQTDAETLAASCPGNLVLKQAGIVFSTSIPRKTSPTGFVTGGDLTLLNATIALQAVSAPADGTTSLSAAQLAQCEATLGDVLRSLPPDDPILRRSLQAEVTKLPKWLPAD